jgi:TolB-like protein/DNA-binding winged helix-turn-helix (wHTH) protein/tetratricopeptide (TPR) repeat protein
MSVGFDRMAVEAPTGAVLRFATFEVDLRTGELRKQGLRIKLQDQPFKILAMLLERPGELVTRQQIQRALWPADTFVDFEHSVNTAVRRLRDALNDDAERPRFIETLPRHGYRFLVEVTLVNPPTNGNGRETEATPAGVRRVRLFPWLWLAGFLLISAAAALLAWSFLPRSVIDSIAVLPFANEARDSDLDYLADGIPGGILERLSLIPSLRVASRNSAFTFRELPVKTSDAASSLHVRAIAIGSIRRKGNLLQVRAELIDSRNDKHLWGGEYTVSPEQLPTLGTNIAGEIATRLHQRFSPDLQARQSGTSPVAYSAYLHGEYVMDTRTNDSLRIALDYLQKAVDADPNFAPAYASMGKAYGLLGWYGGMPPLQAGRLAEAAANRALELDPNLSLAWIVKSACLQNYHHDWLASERAGRRALELAPHSAEINHYYGVGLRRRGRMEEAIAAAQRAEELDPLWVGYTIARLNTYFYARRLDDALQLRQHRPGLITGPRSRLLYGLIYASNGHAPEALDEVRPLKLASQSPLDACMMAQVYAMAGESAEARRALAAGLEKQSAEGRATLRSCSPYDVAAVYAALGNRARMLRALRAAQGDEDPKLPEIFFDPAFDRVRNDPALSPLLTWLKTPR